MLFFSNKGLVWYKLAESLQDFIFNDQGLAEYEVAGKKVCIAVKDGQPFACAHKCPHAGAPMAKGYVDALGNIVCPLHRYKFSLKNGRNVSGEGYYLKTFPVEIREDGIFIGITP